MFLKLIGATTRGLQAQGKDIVEYARALGERYGFPADVYSFAITMYEVCKRVSGSN